MIKTWTHTVRGIHRQSTAARLASQWIPRCPEPTCDCRSMPEGLDIDHDTPMTFSPYREHIVICTGRSDWSSKIELDPHTSPLTRHVKGLLGPKARRGQTSADEIVPGKYHNPFSPHIVSNASFPSPVNSLPSAPVMYQGISNHDATKQPTSAYLFPSFEYVTVPPAAENESYRASLDALIQNHIHATSLRTSAAAQERDIILSQLDGSRPSCTAITSSPVDELIVLICGHRSRDSRCGALAEPLRLEFEETLQRVSINTMHGERSNSCGNVEKSARVGLLSHIGGHKWAGNVILYFPPTWKGHPLAGSGIWYGRVEPRHIQGIVLETIARGRLIQDLWRGGMILTHLRGRASWNRIPHAGENFPSGTVLSTVRDQSKI